MVTIDYCHYRYPKCKLSLVFRKNKLIINSLIFGTLDELTILFPSCKIIHFIIFYIGFSNSLKVQTDPLIIGLELQINLQKYTKRIAWRIPNFKRSSKQDSKCVSDTFWIRIRGPFGSIRVS